MANIDLPSDGIILLLGVTGAGKSYFIEQLESRYVGGSPRVRVGHTLHSETRKCQAHQIILDDSVENQRSITLIDTPGFDDTDRPQEEVLSEITEFLAVQHSLNIPLRGVLYLHQITDNRMRGTSMACLAILEALVGDEAMKNVILVTTMWNKLREEYHGEALQHEQELLDDYWLRMQRKGSYVAQFTGTADSAFALVWQLADKESVVLEIQKGMDKLDENEEVDSTLLHTPSGKSLLQKLEEDKSSYEVRLATVRSQLDAEEAKYGRGDRDTLKKLQQQKAEIESVLRRINRSIAHIEPLKVGSRKQIKMKIEDVLANRAVAGAINVLALVLNITLFVVKATGVI